MIGAGGDMHKRSPDPQRSEPQQRHGAGPKEQVRLDLSLLDRSSMLQLQRHAGNGAVTALLVQRQPKAPPVIRDPKHPENFPTYEGWLEAFGSLPTFESNDRVPAKNLASRTTSVHRTASSA